MILLCRYMNSEDIKYDFSYSSPKLLIVSSLRLIKASLEMLFQAWESQEPAQGFLASQVFLSVVHLMYQIMTRIVHQLVRS